MRPILLPLKAALRALPTSVHAALFTRLFNHLLKGQYLAEQLGEVAGKRMNLHILDTGTTLAFQIGAGRIDPAPANHAWDVRISGRLEDLWLLITRAEDPDTLFFQRRLALEGETETALHIKNLLDAMEFDWRAHLEAVAGRRLAAPLIGLVERAGIEERLAARIPLLR